MGITRREWLKAASAAVAAGLFPHVTACSDDSGDGLPTYVYDGTPGPATMFELGVASGDALADAVVFWTHVSPGFASGAVSVWLEVATDLRFRRRVVARAFEIDETTDYTLKVDVDGLEPGRTYYYRYFANGVASPLGRTRTLPSGNVDTLRFAVASCASYGYGLFHAYRRIAERADLDAVIFLGDYIYEWADGFYPFPSEAVRAANPTSKCTTLDHYRTRHRTQKTDPDLQEAHRQHVWYATWDDHEFVNDATAAGTSIVSHNPATDGDYATRLASARQAYFEYMPVRGTAADSIYRTMRFGSLADVVMLDTRTEGRSGQIADPSTDDASRTMLGATQETWFSNQLAASTARWRIVAQQVPVAHYTLDATTHAPEYLDQWDDYPLARGRLYDAIETHGQDATVILTGDLHGACVFELPRDPWDVSGYDPATGAGSLAVEFICTSVTSPYAPLVPISTEETELAAACPHLRWTNLSTRGYSVVTITSDAVQNDFYGVADVKMPTGGAATFLAGYTVAHGSARAVAAAGAAAADASPPALAP